tara:strand:- start:35 stop:511 length:477 start_codon:yes stop_codon:yes gene_type:complete
MDNKDKLISRQVALKGAIELACHSDMYFESLDEVLATAEIIQNFILSPFYKVAEKNVVNTPATQPSPTIRETSQSPVGQAEFKCPACASKVYDNRADKKSSKSPNFKCGNKQCTAGNNGFPYASWSDEPPAEILVGFTPPDLVQPKSLDNISETEAPF